MMNKSYFLCTYFRNSGSGCTKILISLGKFYTCTQEYSLRTLNAGEVYDKIILTGAESHWLWAKALHRLIKSPVIKNL